MKKLFVGILMVMVMVVGMVGCAGMQPSNENPIYTSYNIWTHKHMKCINYKIGNNFIPVGTELKYIKSGDGWFAIKLNNIKETYVISFNPNWHAGETVTDYKNYLTTEKTFDEMTKNMSDLEINCIKQGKLKIGMSKEAVLLCYGIPPEHRTPDLKSNEWRYWMDKRKHKLIYFFDNKAVTRHEYNKLNNELIIKNTKEL